MGITKACKRVLFKTLSLENYLRFLQRSYFALYRLGVLRMSENYSHHYFVKRFIHRGDVVVDIGANLGYYSMLFARWVGAGGRVYSVEPVAIYNKIFREQAARFPQITLYPYALGLEEKEMIMVESPHTGYLCTGLVHVYDKSIDGELKDQEFAFSAQMKIPSKLFGDLSRIDYLKCDIEGFEYTVLNDMREIIERTKPTVQVEVWPQNQQAVMSLFSSMKYEAFMLQKGKLVRYAQGMDGDFIFIHPDKKARP